MSIQKHLRNTFLTGIFAAIPIALTVFVVVYVEGTTRRLTGFKTPFVGLAVAIGGIYFLGLIVNSIIGRFFIRGIDKLLTHVPVLRDLYQAWKQVALTPGGKEGIFAKVVLIPVENGDLWCIGFTSGEPILGDANTCCVFVPAAPLPSQGRIYLVPISRCRKLELSTEEAFKIILSTGNYLPEPIGASASSKALA